jgi:methionyl-tRNA formyltransferase
MTALRLVFMGTPEFAVPVLARLLEAGHEVAAVYTRAPQPKGRGQRLRPSPVQACAAERQLEVRTPPTLKGAGEHQAFAALEADAAVVVAYGLILPPAILGATRLGCLNLHASLLPRWRGAAPIQRAIMAGDSESGVTVMLMDEGLDTGPVLAAERLALTPETTGGSLHDALAELGAPLLVETLEGFAAGRIAPRPQDPAGATYADKLSRDEGRLDWRRPAAELERLVRGLSPSPGAWFDHQGARVKVLAAEPVEDVRGVPGEVLDRHLTVACGEGGLRLGLVQRGGRRAMGVPEFLRGFPLAPGARLE